LTPTEDVTPAFKLEITDTTKINLRVKAYLMFDEIAWWNEVRNRILATRDEHSDRLLLNFQFKICYGGPACLIVLRRVYTGPPG